MPWKVTGASATGASHVAGDVPCQDAWAQAVVGEWFIGVVCDGAGSAACSDEGARLVCEQVVAAFSGDNAADTTLAALDNASFETRLADALESSRKALGARADDAGHVIKDYACTVVGALVGPTSGWLFHIGDGVGVARQGDTDIVSHPANGEYANQTFFLTGNDWRSRLRITPLSEPSTMIALMSDGAMSFVMDKGGRNLYAPFIDPVARYLLEADPAAGNQALKSTLDDERTHRITGDDKTLLLALRH